MICHRDGWPAPAGGGLDKVLDGYHRIHIAHMGMGMKLHPLDLRMILPLGSRHFVKAVGHEHKIILEFIELHRAMDFDQHTFLEGLLHPGKFLCILEEGLADDAIGIIRHIEAQQVRLGKRKALHLAQGSLKHDIPGLSVHLSDRIGSPCTPRPKTSGDAEGAGALPPFLAEPPPEDGPAC